MPTQLSKIRLVAFKRQEGRCHYCHAPMWLKKPAEIAAKFDLSEGLVRGLQCTAEHLKAKQDGGTNAAGNIVAACVSCNSRRHREKLPLPPEKYAHRVMRRMHAGKWHSEAIRKLCELQGAMGAEAPQ